MSVTLTRAAWVGMHRLTADEDLRLLIEGTILLDNRPTPSCCLAGGVLTAALDAYADLRRANRGFAP